MKKLGLLAVILLGTFAMLCILFAIWLLRFAGIF